MVEIPLFDNRQPEKLPILDHCEGFDAPCENIEAEWTWMTTYYPDPRSNWRYLCEECKQFCLAYWEEMWSEYYASQGFYKSKPLPTEHTDIDSDLLFPD